MGRALGNIAVAGAVATLWLTWLCGPAAGGEALYEAFRTAPTPTSAPASAPAASAVRVARAAGLDTAVVGVTAGSGHADLLAEKYPDATVKPYDDAAAVVAALLAGEVEAVLLDEPAARNAVADHPGLMLMPDRLAVSDHGLAMRVYWKDLVAEVNAALAELREDGVLDDMASRWFDSPAAERSLPEVPLVEDKPALRAAVGPVRTPVLVRGDDGELTGYDIELLRRVAEKIERRLVVREVAADELIPILRAGDVDIVAAFLAITPEMAEQVQFSEPYYQGSVMAVTGKGD